MGATKLMTAAGGGITLDAASTATDKTITIPADNGTLVYANSSGNVGIGTSSNLVFDNVAAARPLVVQSSSSSTTVTGSTNAITICNSDTTTNNSSQLNFAAITGASTNQYSSAIISCIYGARTNGQYATGQLVFSTSTSLNTAPTEKVRIDSSGNLLVGITSTSPSPTYGGVYVVGDRNTGGTNYYAQMFVAHHSSTNHGIIIKELASSGIAAAFLNSSGTSVGQINTTASATSYATSSDYRLKENIAPMTGALDKVAALKPCTYTWKVDGVASQGFIAHELQEVVPDCVTGEKDAVDADGNPVYQGIDTSFLVATLTAAIQELKAELDAAKADIAALKGTA